MVNGTLLCPSQSMNSRSIFCGECLMSIRTNVWCCTLCSTLVPQEAITWSRAKRFQLVSSGITWSPRDRRLLLHSFKSSHMGEILIYVLTCRAPRMGDIWYVINSSASKRSLSPWEYSQVFSSSFNNSQLCDVPQIAFIAIYDSYIFIPELHTYTCALLRFPEQDKN